MDIQKLYYLLQCSDILNDLGESYHPLRNAVLGEITKFQDGVMKAAEAAKPKSVPVPSAPKSYEDKPSEHINRRPE